MILELNTSQTNEKAQLGNTNTSNNFDNNVKTCVKQVIKQWF